MEENWNAAAAPLGLAFLKWIFLKVIIILWSKTLRTFSLGLAFLKWILLIVIIILWSETLRTFLRVRNGEVRNS
jgi:Na+-driven multidrug efflux pump